MHETPQSLKKIDFSDTIILTDSLELAIGQLI